MDYINDIFPYIRLTTGLVSAILAVVLVYSAKNLIGKEWLFASVLLTLLTWPFNQVIQLIAIHSENPMEIYQWFEVVNLPSFFGTACFGLFLFIAWSNSRMKVNIKELLFSFNGRIPRSVFWILGCILVPLSTMIGYAPFTSETIGFPRLIIWIIYIYWLILSIWISLSIYTKRWHDCSKSGWMTLILFIPVIGVLWFMGYLGFVKGTQGTNPYGENLLNVPESRPIKL